LDVLTNVEVTFTLKMEAVDSPETLVKQVEQTVEEERERARDGG